MIVAIDHEHSAVSMAIMNQLSALRARSGRTVLLLDTDASEAEQGQRRDDSNAQPATPAQALALRDLQSALQGLSPSHDDIVIGAGRRDMALTQSVLAAARKVVVPLHPQQADLARQYSLIARLNAARMINPGLGVLFVLVVGAAPLGQQMSAIRGYVAHVMSAHLSSTVLQEAALCGADAGLQRLADAADASAMHALYREVFAT